MAGASARPSIRRPVNRGVRLAVVSLAGIIVGVGLYTGWQAVNRALAPHRTTPVFDPPVLAGQPLLAYCTGNVYARHDQTIVLATAGHCAYEGLVAKDPDGVGVRGVFGPGARDATCPYPGHTCASSDMTYLIVAPDRIPWGHLNLIDLGVGGYRTVTPGMHALSCADIHVGDPVEIDGRGMYRTGRVLGKGANDQDPAFDGSYFPCMVISNVQVASGDSGGTVLVRGIPAGVTSRSFGGELGFTPLAEGLAQLGLTLCDTPDCGLQPPGT